jgi:hypothetical protein
MDHFKDADRPTYFRTVLPFYVTRPDLIQFRLF